MIEEEIISKDETAAPLISMANAGTAASLFGGQTRKRKQTSFYVSKPRRQSDIIKKMARTVKELDEIGQSNNEDDPVRCCYVYVVVI